MGARPSSAKSGGGFLNNVDGVITDYDFTTEKPGGEKKGKGKPANADFKALYFKVFAQADGAEKVVDTSLYTGINANDVEISDDGKTLTPVEEGEDICFPANKPFMLFLAAMTEHGFDESNLPDDGEPVNYEAIINQRVRFVQQVDEQATKDKGKRKGKDGKEYPRQNLIVSAVYGEADAEPVKAGKKTAGKPATSAPKQKGKKSAEPEETDHSETAKEVILEMLKKDDEINRTKVGTPALRAMLKLKVDQDIRDEVMEKLKDAEFLETEDGWSYDAKKGIISAEA